MIEREAPFKEEVLRVVKNYAYIIIPNVGHVNIPIEEKVKAIDWLYAH